MVPDNVAPEIRSSKRLWRRLAPSSSGVPLCKKEAGLAAVCIQSLATIRSFASVSGYSLHLDDLWSMVLHRGTTMLEAVFMRTESDSSNSSCLLLSVLLSSDNGRAVQITQILQSEFVKMEQQLVLPFHLLDYNDVHRGVACLLFRKNSATRSNSAFLASQHRLKLIPIDSTLCRCWLC